MNPYIAYAVGGVVVLLVMMLVVVRIARAMERAARPAAAAAAGKSGDLTKLIGRLRASATREDGAAAAAKADGGAQSKAAAKEGKKAVAVVGAVVAVIVGFIGVIKSQSDADEPPVSSEITAGPLHGTLLSAGKPKRVVLIVPGSGPTDRDGDNPMGVKAAPYRLLAEGLAAKNIASVRIDKRGMFASREAGDPNAVSIRIYADDIHAWIDAVKAETGARCVWLLGHSEGALMVSAAAEGRKDVCGLILVSGAGRKLGDVLREQLKANPANAPILDAALAALGELEAGPHVDPATLPPALAGLFNAPAQDFLISEIGVDPVELVRRAKKKTLIVQGTTDLQVSVDDAMRLDKAPRTRLRLIQGMNHVLKLAPADRAANIAAYADPALPLAPKLVNAIANFVKDDD